MKNINKLNQTRRNNKNNKIKSLELEPQANSQINNSKHLKSWTNDISSLKLKGAFNASLFKSSNIKARSSGDKKSDAFFDNLITIEELADYIGVSQKTIRNWISLRTIPFLRIGKKTFFRVERMRVWLQTKEYEPCQ